MFPLFRFCFSFPIFFDIGYFFAPASMRPIKESVRSKQLIFEAEGRRGFGRLLPGKQVSNGSKGWKRGDRRPQEADYASNKAGPEFSDKDPF